MASSSSSSTVSDSQLSKIYHETIAEIDQLVNILTAGILTKSDIDAIISVAASDSPVEMKVEEIASILDESVTWTSSEKMELITQYLIERNSRPRSYVLFSTLDGVTKEEISLGYRHMMRHDDLMSKIAFVIQTDLPDKDKLQAIARYLLKDLVSFVTRIHENSNKPSDSPATIEVA